MTLEEIKRTLLDKEFVIKIDLKGLFFFAI